jgi:ankyrin repeat protein
MALHSAVANADATALRHSLMGGADVNELQEGRTPLTMAIEMSDKDISVQFMELLLNAGADINQTDAETTPLRKAVAAAVCSGLEKVKLLLQKGADIHERGENGKCIVAFVLDLHCVEWEHDLLTLLQATRADFNAIDNAGMTPLMHFVQKVKHETNDDNYSSKSFVLQTLQILKGFNVDFNAVDDEGRTALSIVAEFVQSGQLNIHAPDFVTVLIQSSDVNLGINSTGMSVLQMVSDCDSLTDEVIHAGANPLHTDQYGRTALHHAVPNSYTFRVLLKAGADPTIVDSGGETAVQYCERVFPTSYQTFKSVVNSVGHCRNS